MNCSVSHWRLKKFAIQLCKHSCGFTLLELMIVIALISILAAIAFPNYINYRYKAFCTEAELDANSIGMAISDYYADAHHTGLPEVSDLETNTKNTYELIGHPDNVIEIKVKDRTNKCPDAYQQGRSDWDANVFTKFIR